MRRFRRKSDARRRSGKTPPRGEEEAEDDGQVGARSGSTTPAVQLPAAEHFRTSLILPNLMRRFSLLRTEDGQLLNLETIQTHLDRQRQTGVLTAYEVDAVLEQYRLQAEKEAAGQTPALPKRTRIDWSKIEDENAFLDSLSLASNADGSSTGYGSSWASFTTAANDDTRSIRSPSSSRPPPVPPPPAHHSSQPPSSPPQSYTQSIGCSSSPHLPSSPPLSRDPSSSSAAGSPSQGYPYRIKRGTNSLFGGRTHDARELKMLRSASGQSLGASVVGHSALETRKSGGEVAAAADAPESAALDGESLKNPSEPKDTPEFGSSRREDDQPDGDTDAGGLEGQHLDRPESADALPAASAIPRQAENAGPASPTTPLSAKQLRRISTALDAIEVELAKTFSRLSWADEGEDDAGQAGEGQVKREATTEVEHETQPEVDGRAGVADDDSPDAKVEVVPDATEGLESGRVSTTGDVETSSLTSAGRPSFEMVGVVADVVPPSPISPVTESDLRGVGTFDRTDVASAMRERASSSPTPSETEELGPAFSDVPERRRPEVPAARQVDASDAPSGITIPLRPAHLRGLKVEGSEDWIEVPATEEATAGPASPVRRANAPAIGDDWRRNDPADVGGQGELRESHAVPQASVPSASLGSTRSAVSDPSRRKKVPAEEDFGHPLETEEAPGRVSAIRGSPPEATATSADGPDAAALAQQSPPPPPPDRHLSEALMRNPFARADPVPAGGSDGSQVRSREQFLPMLNGLVRAASQRRLVANGGGRTLDVSSGRPISGIAPDEVPESMHRAPDPVASTSAEAAEDQAVEQLTGLGFDDYGAADFTQESPEQRDAATFAPHSSAASKPSPNSSNGSAEKPSPGSNLGLRSVAMSMQDSQHTNESHLAPSSVISATTSSPSDAFEYSSLVTSRNGSEAGITVERRGTLPLSFETIERSPLAEVVVPAEEAVAADPADYRSPGGTPVAVETVEVASALVDDEDSAALAEQGDEPSGLVAGPRTGPVRNRSQATSMLVRDVQSQATLATNALKQHDQAQSASPPLRKIKTVRKQKIGSPQLVSGPVHIPAVPIASPEIVSPSASPSLDSPARRKTRTSSDAAQSKSIGSRFKRLLSKRDPVRAGAAAVALGPAPTRPPRPDDDPITPPNQATAQFASPTLTSPQTPSTMTASPGGSTPQPSPRKKPPPVIFPSKRSTLSPSPRTSSEDAARVPGRTAEHSRGQSFGQGVSRLGDPLDISDSSTAFSSPTLGDAGQSDPAFSAVAPLSPRRAAMRRESAGVHAPNSPSTSSFGKDSRHVPRASVESIMRFRQAAEGLGLDPEKVHELVSSAYAGSPTASSHAHSGSTGSSGDRDTAYAHSNQWARTRNASRGSSALATPLEPSIEHGDPRRGEEEVDGPDSRHRLNDSEAGSSRLADPFPAALHAPDQSRLLRPPRSPAMESAPSQQGSSDYANSFLDFYAHEEGETDNEGPFNLSAGSASEPFADDSGRLSLAEPAGRSAERPGLAQTPSGEVVWQVLDDLRSNRFSVASHGSSLGFGSHDSSNGAEDSADPVAPLGHLLRHRGRQPSSASLASEWDGRYPSIYLREEKALIELAQQGGIALDESGRFLVRPKNPPAPEMPPVPEQYRDQVAPPVRAGQEEDTPRTEYTEYTQHA